MFENIPTNFFNLLVSKNRELFVKALFVLRKSVRQDLYLTRDEYASRLVLALEDDIKNSFVAEDDTKFENEDLTSVNAKALFIIRKLRDYGWINIDFNAKNSFEEYIAVPSYSTTAINFLYALSNEGEDEYNSLVYSTYAALKMADTESNNFYDALVTAYKNTDRLNESLSNLYYGIRSIEQRITDHLTINDVASIHFNEYLLSLHERYYHPYKTFDSVQRYRSPILKILKKWINNTSVRKSIMDVSKDKNPNLKNDALYEQIANMYDLVISTYDSIEEKMDIIDKKINDYTSSTIDKMKHLVNMDESYKGKLTFLIKVINENKDHADEITDIFIDNTILQLQEYVSLESAYSKREIPIIPDIPPVEIIEEDKSGDDVDELRLKLAEGYNTNRIKEFILSRANGQKEVTIEEIRIMTDEDFILSILAMLRGDEKELPFKVEFDEGYLQVRNYRVPNIKFIMKEGKQ